MTTQSTTLSASSAGIATSSEEVATPEATTGRGTDSTATIRLRERRPAWQRLLIAVGPHVAFVTLLLGLWTYATDRWIHPLVLSSPASVANALYDWFTTGYIWPHLGATVFALSSGFIVGGIVAFILAVVLTELPRLGRFVEPYIITFDAIPNIALVPIFIVWFGFGIGNKVLMAYLTAFFVVFIASYQGIRNTDARYLELARVLGASQLQTLFKIRLWYSIPFLASAAKVALPRTALAVVIAEFLGSNRGLGYLIVRSSNLLNIPNLLAGVVILTILVQVLSRIAAALERLALSWVPKEKT